MRINKNILTSIAGASLVLSFFGFIGKGVGFLREIIFASQFGLSRDFDLFLSSAALPFVVNTAVIYLGQHYFIPIYNRFKNESKQASTSFLNYAFWKFLTYSIIISLILYILSSYLISIYMSSLPIEMQNLGTTNFRLILITIPLNAGMAIIMAFLQAEFKFITPAISLLLLNLVIIIVLVLFNGILDLLILPISFVIGYILSFGFLLFFVRRQISIPFRAMYRINLPRKNNNYLLALVIIEGLSLAYILVDRFFVGIVTEGGIASLNYAFVIYSLPISLFSLPLITTMFSKFSNNSNVPPNLLSSDLTKASGINNYIFVLFTVIFLFWCEIFLEFFYKRGKFTQENVEMTKTVLQIYSFSLVFISMYFLQVKIFYSMNKYQFVVIISIIAFSLKILFSLILVEKYSQNGLAISTSLIYLFLFLISITYTTRILRGSYSKSILQQIVYFSLNALLSLLMIQIILLHIVETGLLINILLFMSFISIYVMNSLFLKDYEVLVIKNTIKNFFK